MVRNSQLVYQIGLNSARLLHAGACDHTARWQGSEVARDGMDCRHPCSYTAGESSSQEQPPDTA